MTTYLVIIRRLHVARILWDIASFPTQEVLVFPAGEGICTPKQDPVMSDVQEHFEEHASPIKTPKQLIVTVVLAFVVPIIIIILLVNWVAAGNKPAAGADSLAPETVAKRIAPVAGFALVDANAPRVLKTGEQVYTTVCASCHSAGVAGAPKFGDNAAWAPLIQTGYDAMLKIALEGKGAMPAKGGNPLLDELEVARALVYMTNHSGGSLPEPAEPAEVEPAVDAAAAQ